MCGTYTEKLISTISFYVVLIPYGIGDVVLISLTSYETGPAAAVKTIHVAGEAESTTANCSAQL